MLLLFWMKLEVEIYVYTQKIKINPKSEFRWSYSKNYDNLNIFNFTILNLTHGCHFCAEFRHMRKCVAECWPDIANTSFKNAYAKLEYVAIYEFVYSQKFMLQRRKKCSLLSFFFVVKAVFTHSLNGYQKGGRKFSNGLVLRMV